MVDLLSCCHFMPVTWIRPQATKTGGSFLFFLSWSDLMQGKWFFIFLFRFSDENVIRKTQRFSLFSIIIIIYYIFLISANTKLLGSNNKTKKSWKLSIFVQKKATLRIVQFHVEYVVIFNIPIQKFYNYFALAKQFFCLNRALAWFIYKFK